MAGHSRRWALATIDAAAKHYGIRPAFLYGIWGAETDFSRAPDTYRPNVANAKGPFQLTPDTARSLGINWAGNGRGSPNDFRAAAFAAAHELSKYKRYGESGMAAAYNGGPGAISGHRYAETVNYIPKVLALSKGYPGSGGLSLPGAPSAGTGPVQQTDFAGVLRNALASQPALPRASAVPQAPSFSALSLIRDPRPAQAAGLEATIGPPPPQPKIASAAPITLPGATPAPSPSRGTGAVTGASHGLQTPGLGSLVYAPGAGRRGNHTVDLFGRALAAKAGEPLTVGTSTRHSYLTTSGRVSDHVSGNALDIRADGKRLTRLGREAMEMFGQRPDNGGLHTFYWKAPNGANYRIQIIYNTYAGGNHYTHLHLGVRRA